ncbi:MAG: polysaccharide deacetylase family protein [Pirellulaceae bacterium]
MQNWRRLLLSAYVAGTNPYRRWAARQAADEGRAPIVVLFYHRVADDHPNPWTISTAVFSWQVEWMTRHVDIISLEEAQRRLREQDSRRPAACITFDDGYADNCRHALPLLVKERIPFTYFVSTEYVLKRLPFPHDAERGEPLEPNTVEQLRALAAAGVEIGAHTRTHPDLGRIHDPQRLREEVIASADTLAEMVGRPMRYFAFPFGQRENLNREVFRMARAHGLLGVCSAYGGYNMPGDDAFHLQRVHADPEPARFVNWMTIDPRKRRLPRFDAAADAAPKNEAARDSAGMCADQGRIAHEQAVCGARDAAAERPQDRETACDESPAVVGSNP